MKQDRILVIGSGGTVGSEIVKNLKKEGYPVRETTHKKVGPTRPDLVQLDLATGEGLRAAFEGIDRAFLISPPGYANHHAILSPLIQEAKRRGLKKVVLMTAMGANASEDIPFRKAEIELEKSGLAYNIVRPNWFFQNMTTFWVQGIREQGKILVPGGRAKVSFIDARDIGEVAAKLLVDDQHNNRDFDITGPESVDHDEVARALSEATGKKITYEEIEPATLKKGLLAGGVPADYVEFLLAIFAFLREGYNARITGNVKLLTGHEPRKLRDFAQDYRSAW